VVVVSQLHSIRSAVLWLSLSGELCSPKSHLCMEDSQFSYESL